MAIFRRSVPAVSVAVGGMVAAAALTVSPALAGSGAAAGLSAGGCDATARIESQWSGGQIVAVKVTNSSPQTTTKWAVTWTPGAGQRVVAAWNAAVTTSGGTATAVNAFYNGTLAPGASATFGMQLAGVGAAPALSCDNGASTPPAGQTVTVTQADNLKTVRLRAGDSLVVSLAADYVPPKLSVAGVLEPGDIAGGFPTGQPLVARYSAVAAGTTAVSTQTDIACNHDPMPCPSPPVPWSITVIVAA